MGFKESRLALTEDLLSTLVQLARALNDDDEADIEHYSKISLDIIKKILEIYEIELNKEPKKKSLLNGRVLFFKIYDILEKEEYTNNLDNITKKLRKLIKLKS